MAKNKNSSSSDKNTVLLYGRHPVLAAISNPARRILKIYASAENATEIKTHLSACQKDNLPLQIVDRKDIDKMLPREAVHQGLPCNAKSWKIIRLKISVLWRLKKKTAIFWCSTR